MREEPLQCDDCGGYWFEFRAGQFMTPRKDIENFMRSPYAIPAHIATRSAAVVCVNCGKRYEQDASKPL